MLAWYVNGSLAGADRDRIEEALQRDPDAAVLVGWERAVQSAIKADPLFDVPPDRGLFQVLQRIRAEASAETPKAAASRRMSALAAPKPSGPGWLARLRDSFNSSPALALACSLLIVQFGVIVHLYSTRGEESDYSGVRAVETRPPPDAFIRITFKPQSTEAQISSLLRDNHAEIVAGPSQLGDYYLLVGRGDAPDALTQLQANTHVESAEIVNALPSRP